MDKVIVDAKVVKSFADEHISQMIGYLRITGLQLGLLLNFKKSSLQFKRVVTPAFTEESDPTIFLQNSNQEPETNNQKEHPNEADESARSTFHRSSMQSVASASEPIQNPPN
jgi:hypothetical protein